jgi:hypothetical protein
MCKVAHVAILEHQIADLSVALVCRIVCSSATEVHT